LTAGPSGGPAFFAGSARLRVVYSMVRMRLILNPFAGGGMSPRLRNRLHKALRENGVRYELLETTHPGHARELAREAAASDTRIAVIGGDGTISEAIDGIVNSGVELGIVSMGTGNDLARSLGIPFNSLEAAVAVACTGKPKRIDVGWERDRHFATSLGLGFPAAVVEERNRIRWLKGSAAFFFAVYRAIRWLHPFWLQLELDDRSIEIECTIVLVQNTPYCGGGFMIAPEAEVDDGLLDVVVIKPIGKMDLMLNFPKVYRGRHLDHPSFSVYRSRQVRIHSAEPLRKTFDGDIYGTAPVEARALPRAIKLIVPNLLTV
jgi:diacylglycerol kinase (ATP)